MEINKLNYQLQNVQLKQNVTKADFVSDLSKAAEDGTVTKEEFAKIKNKYLDPNNQNIGSELSTLIQDLPSDEDVLSSIQQNTPIKENAIKANDIIKKVISAAKSDYLVQEPVIDSGTQYNDLILGTKKVSGNVDLNSSTKSQRLDILESITQVDDNSATKSDDYRCVAASGVAAAFYNEGAAGLDKLVGSIFTGSLPSPLDDVSGNRGMKSVNKDTLVTLGKIGGKGEKQFDAFMAKFGDTKKFGDVRDKVFIEIDGKFYSQTQINNDKSNPPLKERIKEGSEIVYVASGKNPQEIKDKAQQENKPVPKINMEALREIQDKIKKDPNSLTKNDIAIIQDSLFGAIGGSIDPKSGGSDTQNLVKFFNDNGLGDLLKNTDLLSVSVTGENYKHQVLGITTDEGSKVIYDPSPRGNSKDLDGTVLDQGQVSSNKKVVDAYYSKKV